ncbi:colicin D domain-containing protein [Serratia sp. NPDC078593]|uniref:colicin D domain-containing protein n=1 Tax=unclassified Serratia (in: enterobacteria) TaxID=2647522 RepID=UPI0037CDDF70
MFTLYMKWDARLVLAPEDIQFILSPRSAMELACIFYELDYLQYPQQRICRHSVPQRREAAYCNNSATSYKRKHRAQCDKLFDDVQWQLELGWMIGVDTSAEWDYRRNPFYFDADSNLIYDCFMGHGCEMFPREVREIYEYTLDKHRGRKPAPTVKQHYFGAPVQHAQAAKTINSKAAGRLLAAGGIYNGNIEGFHKAAQQLGGDAPDGYDQVMDNKGLLIAGASAVAGLGLGRLGTVSELEELSALSKAPKPFPSKFVNFEPRQLQKKFKHAVDFNVSGNPNTVGLKSFEHALKEHIDDPLTQKITGKYRWDLNVYHYYNPETKLNVMTKSDGNFISGWKLSETQQLDLIGEGNVF